MRGRVWLAKHEYERAIADFTEATKTHSDYFVYNYRGEANEQKGDRDAAIADYRRALALNPDEKVRNDVYAAPKTSSR